mmetsp:Transcript_32761/g.80277  ORF Transcript_32761/g.80277 Transcript_32761/m.80277 type:complete len:330 (+) Transcript_32761:362-1351(+)
MGTTKILYAHGTDAVSVGGSLSLVSGSLTLNDLKHALLRSTSMYTHSAPSAAMAARFAFWCHGSSRRQSVTARYTSTLRASRRSASATASSSGSASSSAWCASLVSVMKCVAASSATSCVSAATVVVTVAIEPHGVLSSAASSAALTRRKKAPASVVGTMRKMTGSEPISMRHSERRRMPVSTDVGQSGPPTSMATLLGVSRPGAVSILRMLRMSSELTPTALRTPTKRLMSWPISFCCMAIASSFMANATVHAYAMAPGYVMNGSAWRPSMTPAARYTGTPGTGGSRNITSPTATKMSVTTTRPSASPPAPGATAATATTSSDSSTLR